MIDSVDLMIDFMVGFFCLQYFANVVRTPNTKYLTVWKVSNYGVISDPYFPVFSPNTGKYGPEITPYLDTFHTVSYRVNQVNIKDSRKEYAM